MEVLSEISLTETREDDEDDGELGDDIKQSMLKLFFMEIAWDADEQEVDMSRSCTPKSLSPILLVVVVVILVPPL